jgi:hypothetical protein
MGAVTVAIRKRTGLGAASVIRIADVTFSGAYAAGGDTYTNAQFEMGTIDAIIPISPAVASATTGFDVMPDLANKKLRLMGGAAAGVALAETAVANQAATVVRVLVIGDNPSI